LNHFFSIFLRLMDHISDKAQNFEYLRDSILPDGRLNSGLPNIA